MTFVLVNNGVRALRLANTVGRSQYLRENFVPASISLFHSRAHPQPKPEFPVADALNQVLHDIKQRNLNRNNKWKRNGKEERDPPDETIEMALNLNLDPRKPGQALRGSISLPHGTGKKGVECIVFTGNADLKESCLKVGAVHAGGEEIIDQIADGTIPINNVGQCLATTDIMPTLSKKLARILGPRGIMPNAKVGTLVQDPSDLLGTLETQVAGKEITYRTEKEGIVHVIVGKGSFEPDSLLENIGEVMKTIYEVKPESYGKGKKGKSTGKGTKYLLKASLTSTQGKGIRLDLRTIDPSSLFFLKSGDALDLDSSA